MPAEKTSYTQLYIRMKFYILNLKIAIKITQKYCHIFY